jgi:hypothetical protein
VVFCNESKCDPWLTVQMDGGMMAKVKELGHTSLDDLVRDVDA